MKERSVNLDNQHLSSKPLRGFFLLALSVLFLPFVSAQFGFGYGFSIEGFLDNFLNSSISVYILLFFIMFTVITLILSRVSLFRGQYGQPNAFAAGVVSFSISALAIYYLYQSGFQGESLLSWLGLSGDSLSILVLILVVLVAILMVWKLGFKGLFFFGGLALVLTALSTELFYERGLAMIIGIVFLVIGLWLWQRTRGMVGSMGSRAWAGAKRKPMWAVAILGIILTITGFFAGGAIVILIGVLLMIVGFFGKRAYSETPFATGRNMSARRAETEAYQEEAERQRIAQQRQLKLDEEEARRMQAQVEQIEAQINLIDNNIRRYQRALRGARSPQEAATIRNGIIDLENQKRDLLNALRQLTHS